MVTALTAQPGWVARGLIEGPAGQTMITDTVRRRVVTADFGLVEWDGRRWGQQQPGAFVGGPAALGVRAVHAYDSARAELVAHADSSEYGATWAWTGTAWEQRYTASLPSPRTGFALAFDARRERVVMFGGGADVTAPFAPLDEALFEWDGAEWSHVVPSGPTPSARIRPSLVYDAARQRVVMIGGGRWSRSGIGRPFVETLDEVWEWDGTQWAPGPAVSVPAPPPYVFDAAHGEIVGVGPGGLWGFNGSRWALRPGTLPPGPISTLQMGFDPARHRLLLVTYYRGSVGPGTWGWDGTQWRVLSPPAPVLPQDLVLAADDARQEVVRFGGLDLGYSPTADTWTWDGADWRRRTPATVPSSRSNHAMAYDRARRVVVMFGGESGGARLDRVWEWDGADWTGLVATPGPTARYGHAMAYDAARGRVVLFGGARADWSAAEPWSRALLADTWEWDGTQWWPRTPPIAPPARHFHGMAYDPVRQRVVLFGGTPDPTGVGQAPVGSNDTWEWDGVQWTPQPTALAPPARFGHAMAYHPTLGGGGVMVIGDRDRVLAQLWRWDGAQWSVVPVRQQPESNLRAMVYDAARDEMVAGGGWFPRGTWLLGGRHAAAAVPAAAPACAGPGLTPPVLTPFCEAVLGRPFAVDLYGAPPHLGGVFLVGAVPALIPVGGCTLAVSSASGLWLPFTATANGFATLPLRVPSVPAFGGGTFHVQAVTTDALSPFAPFGLTRALAVTVGS
ncbi:MAG: kelch repeat-containing protein [Planctomycetota bacterium]